jgi:hypothetical protein
MTITTINIGNNANDGLGDDLRTAFEKVNANFTELAVVANAITDVNIIAPTTPSGYSIFKGLTGSTLTFKNLTAGNNITLYESQNSVSIMNTASMFNTVVAGVSEFDAGLSSIIKFSGDDDIIVSLTPPIAGSVNPTTPAIPGIVNIRSAYSINTLLKTYDFGQLDNVINSVFDLYLTTYSVDFGSITSPNSLSIDLGTTI